MARVIPTAMRDAILSGVTYPVMLARIDWPTGEVRVHSGTGTLVLTLLLSLTETAEGVHQACRGRAEATGGSVVATGLDTTAASTMTARQRLSLIHI